MLSQWLKRLLFIYINKRVCLKVNHKKNIGMQTTLKLIAGDEVRGSFVEIRKSAASSSKLITSMTIEDDCVDIDEDEDYSVPLLEVSRVILLKVVEFLEHTENDPMKSIEVPLKTNKIEDVVGEFHAKFVNDMDQETLFRVLLAADYLEIASLSGLTTCKIACMMKGVEVEEIKQIFNIEGNITAEEEKTVRDANPWIFDLCPTTNA